ncbi:MAG: TonB-dependent receptor [Sandarakinorhabdus sp.]|nr:TonB-dependent receptor [Sandarakinorhabdus sp.]
MVRIAARFLAGSAVALMATSVTAQVAATDVEAGQEEIVVTALRRLDTLQNTPASITAFTADAIQAAGIERPADFIALTPNVNLVETQNAGNAFIIIRGITQARNSEPSVAVVVDGVQQVNPAQFNQELFDIEQIEVLQGPQGGLYGRNAIGGAIIIRTKQPTDVYEGRFTAGFDNGFSYYLRGVASGPITDTLRFRIAGSFLDSEGFIPNPFLGEDADPVQDFSLRGTLLWEPTENLTLDLRGSLSWLETQALYFNIVSDVNDTSLPVRVNNAGQNDRDIYNVALRARYEGDGGSITSVTSYDKLTEVLTGDAFNFLPIPESLFFFLFGFDLNQSQFLEVESWSQDLRYESPTGQPLEWSVGAYAVGTKRYISTGNMIDTGQGVFPVFRNPSTNPANPQATFLADSQDNFAWSVYANATWNISEQLRLDGSLRYDEDKRENTTLTPPAFLPNIPGFPPAVTGEVRDKTFSEWQPKVTLTWRPDPGITLYGGWSRGFRSGGFNQTGVGAIAAANGIVGVNDIFEAEVAETFEVGAKFQTDDRRFNLNLAGFATETENSYFFVFLAANSTQNLGNVPRTRINGFEVDANWRAFDGFDLNAAVGFTDSKITDFPNPAFEGNEAPLISRYTLNLGAQYRGDISDTVGLLARVDYRRIGRTWWDVENSTSRDPVDLVDARLGLEMGNWSLTAFGSNIFDVEYNAEFSPGGFVFKARPRRYGVEASLRF